jgi:hypothetical protein
MTQEDKKTLPELAKEKAARARQHLKDNKKVYFAAGSGAVVGAVGVFFATGGHVMIVDGVKFIHLQYKSPNVNVSYPRPSSLSGSDPGSRQVDR